MMLARFVLIDKEGNFELRGDPRSIYQIMVSTRLLILYGSPSILLRLTLLATRYAVCRRQF